MKAITFSCRLYSAHIFGAQPKARHSSIRSKKSNSAVKSNHALTRQRGDCCGVITRSQSNDSSDRGDTAEGAAPNGAFKQAADLNTRDNTTSVLPSSETKEASSSSSPASTADGNPTEATTSAPADPHAPVTWKGMFILAVQKVRTNIWPLLLIHFCCDIFIFALHRASHRLTNELAVNFLGGGFISPASIGNMWWLTSDPGIANFQTGYQALTILVFLLAFPINVLLKTLASATTILICKDDAGAGVQAPWWKPFSGLRRAAPVVRSVAPTIATLWASVFVVELLVSAAVIPLQFASLAVITLPLTLPLILSLHAAAPAAVLEGRKGWDAVQRSRKLIKPVRWALAVPFVGLVVGQRVLEAAKGRVMAAMPPRYYKELIEIPVGILIGGVILSVFMSRMQDVLPFVAYSEAVRKETMQENELPGDGAVLGNSGGE